MADGNNNNKGKTRKELVANIPRDCIQCDACKAPGAVHECQRCHTVHFCSSYCLRQLSGHQCVDVETMRNAIIGIGMDAPVVDVSEAMNTTCGICLEDQMTDPIVLPNCKHAFCRQCLREWHAFEKFKKETTCPTCRSVLLNDQSEDNPIEKAKIYGARAHKHSNNPEQKLGHCERALQELDKLLSRDGSNILALFTKAEILLLQSKPKDALEVLDTILDIDYQNRSKRETVARYLDQVDAAGRSGNTLEADRLMTLVHEIAGTRGEHIGNILENLVDIFLLKADVLQQLGEWFAAKEVYKDLLELPAGVPRWIIGGVMATIILIIIYGMAATITKYFVSAFWSGGVLSEIFLRYGSSRKSKKKTILSFPKELRTPSVPQQRQCYMNMTKCYYNLQDYTRAIYAGELALHMNRHYAGVHEYVAKANKAKGNMEEAQRTMQRAVLYETPWDTDNIEKQLAMLEEITTRQ